MLVVVMAGDKLLGATLIGPSTLKFPVTGGLHWLLTMQ
jgi:hypothetical protein